MTSLGYPHRLLLAAPVPLEGQTITWAAAAAAAAAGPDPPGDTRWGQHQHDRRGLYPRGRAVVMPL
jgi:hypothetical protein